MELLDLYDKNGNKKGITVFRGEYIRYDDYILVVHIYIYNGNNEFLIQRRSRKKKVNSGKWDITGGAVQSNETSIDAAVRETFEEIGLKIDKEKLRLVKRHVSVKHLVDVYFIKMDVDVSKLVLQEEEVSEVRYVSYEDLLKSFKKSDFQDPKYVKIIEAEVSRIMDEEKGS